MPHYYFLVVIAVVLQIFRHYEQKKLIDHFDKSTITLMRFLLPLPFAVVYLTIFHHLIRFKIFIAIGSCFCFANQWRDFAIKKSIKTKLCQ